MYLVDGESERGTQAESKRRKSRERKLNNFVVKSQYKLAGERERERERIEVQRQS